LKHEGYIVNMMSFDPQQYRVQLHLYRHRRQLYFNLCPPGQTGGISGSVAVPNILNYV